MTAVLVLVILGALFVLILDNFKKTLEGINDSDGVNGLSKFERMDQAMDEIQDLREVIEDIIAPYVAFADPEDYREVVEIPSNDYYQIVGALDRINELRAVFLKEEVRDSSLPQKLVFWGPYGSTELTPSNQEAA